MPKQIDHAAYRLELARKVAPLFSEHGYSGLGMRRVAEELGLSKSALYHYFPTKKSLFLACTEVVMSPPEDDLPADRPDESAAEALLGFARRLEPGFASEMSLLFDYLRGKSPDEIAADPAMALANEEMRHQVEKHCRDNDADAVLCLLLGTLLMRHFTGGRLDYDRLFPALEKLL
ncbi:TetR/AcrR family transcriptional regulator [Roseibium sp.]|uniref:TetR/AcrR family transcriptional regulator n=1 Tax=Roseibium sp. TaxID=1936156 RepID=UPI003D11CE51